MKMLRSRGLTKKGKWVYGWYAQVGTRHWIILDGAEVDGFDHNDDYITGIVEIISGSACRMLGWKNKYDQELWEGDILESEGGVRRLIIYDPVDHWGWCFNTGAEISNAYHWKVVGNIHEHSNLLGEKNE